jgi:hypothetical protein
VIDEKVTFEEFGYTSDKLSLHSHKKVYVICPQCKLSRILTYDNYTSRSGLCRSCASSNAKIGIKNPMYGREVSILTKQKQSIIRTGMKRSKETCYNLSQSKIGEHNPMWKGGITNIPYPHEFFEVQIYIREFSNNRCEMCNKSKIDNKSELSVHHIDSNKENNNITNLIALCKSCHGKSHNTTTQSHFEYIKSIEDYEWN